MGKLKKIKLNYKRIKKKTKKTNIRIQKCEMSR